MTVVQLQAEHMNVKRQAANDDKSLDKRVQFMITRGLFNDLASFRPTLRGMIWATMASAGAVWGIAQPSGGGVVQDRWPHRMVKQLNTGPSPESARQVGISKIRFSRPRS